MKAEGFPTLHVVRMANPLGSALGGALVLAIFMFSHYVKLFTLYKKHIENVVSVHIM